jgi:hypothetical protein
MAQQLLVGQGLLIIEASRWHSDARHSVGLLWTSDQHDAEISTWQNTTLTTDRHPCPRRDSNPQSQQASGRRPTLRPRGHWDRQQSLLMDTISKAVLSTSHPHNFVSQDQSQQHIFSLSIFSSQTCFKISSYRNSTCISCITRWSFAHVTNITGLVDLSNSRSYLLLNTINVPLLPS